MLAAAITVWSAVEGWSAGLEGVRIELRDLPGLALAETLGTTIVIDPDAAGWGWSRGDGAIDRMDLLTVLVHELGHVLGHEHAVGIMSPSLRPGERFDVRLMLVDHPLSSLADVGTSVVGKITADLRVVTTVRIAVPALLETSVQSLATITGANASPTVAFAAT